MSRNHISWIENGTEDETIAHKQHSNIKLTTPVRDICIHDEYICVAMSTEIFKSEEEKLEN